MDTDVKVQIDETLVDALTGVVQVHNLLGELLVDLDLASREVVEQARHHLLLQVETNLRAAIELIDVEARLHSEGGTSVDRR